MRFFKYLSLSHTLHFSILSLFSFTEAFLSVACSHERSYIYFAESLAAEPCKFTAYPCDSYEDFVKGTCNVCGDSPCPVMGNDAILSQSRRGNFYLVTNAQNPYCSKWEWPFQYLPIPFQTSNVLIPCINKHLAKQTSFITLNNYSLSMI